MHPLQPITEFPCLPINKGKIMKQILLIVAISCYLFSCSEETLEIISFGKCNGGIMADSLAMHTQLIGAWTWTEISCSFSANPNPTLADKDVTATFNSNSTYSILENSAIAVQGTWEVQKSMEGYIVSIQNLSTVHYLDGSISICENQLLADSSPGDGCKYLFVKAK